MGDGRRSGFVYQRRKAREAYFPCAGRRQWECLPGSMPRIWAPLRLRAHLIAGRFRICQGNRGDSGPGRLKFGKPVPVGPAPTHHLVGAKEICSGRRAADRQRALPYWRLGSGFGGGWEGFGLSQYGRFAEVHPGEQEHGYDEEGYAGASDQKALQPGLDGGEQGNRQDGCRG